MHNEVRVIAIDDFGTKIEIPNYGTVRGPVKKIIVPETTLHTLFNMYNGPKFIYFIDPLDETNRVRVTCENILWSVDKIFGRDVPPEPVVVVEEPVKTQEAQAEVKPFTEEKPISEEKENEDIVNDVTEAEDSSKESFTISDAIPEEEEKPVVIKDIDEKEDPYTQQYVQYSNQNQYKKKRHQ